MPFLVVVVLASVVVGYLVGGRLQGFERVHLRWWPLAIGGLAVQVAPVPDTGGEAERVLGLGMLVASYWALIGFGLLNARNPGMPLAVAGLLMNFIVISINGGMPVTRDALVATGQEESISVLLEGDRVKHHLAGPEDHLVALADVIPIGAPFHQVVSAGDVVLYVGVAWLIVAVMRRRAPRPATPARDSPAALPEERAERVPPAAPLEARRRGTEP